MIKSLWLKLLITLSTISLIALSSSLILRELMIKDFRDFLEGELEDRVYWVTADLEGTYEKFGEWRIEAISEDITWALMLGLETKVFDNEGRLVIDTEKATNMLPPLMKRRILAISGLGRERRDKNEFVVYPLFLGGKEIGSLEVRFLKTGRENIYIKRSDRFFLLSLLIIGGLAIILSIIFSRRFTKPIERLNTAAEAIGDGNLKSRVNISGTDELARLAATFNSMAKSLETQESLRKKLISNIAHELRTPVSAIKGEIEGMIDGIIPINKEGLQSLNEEISRLKFLIEGLEELAQAQASTLLLRKQSINLHQFLKNIMDRFYMSFRDKNITTEIQCDEGLAVTADPERLSQIIINLLDNGLKATGQGGKIWIKAGSKGLATYIEIGDTGCGIKQEELPFIFERFYRSFSGGLGLGLAIVKELVDAHNGRIEVKSEYGKGTVFTILLPKNNSCES
ncbi:MAG: ATP-binding protein [Thermodesulfovibrionales bacterium]